MSGRYFALIAFLGLIILSCQAAPAQEPRSIPFRSGGSSGESGSNRAGERTGQASASPAYAVPWWSADSGGDTAAGGSLVVSGVIGQPDAAVMTGSDYRLEGGFVPVYRSICLFSDSFESGDTSRWALTNG